MSKKGKEEKIWEPHLRPLDLLKSFSCSTCPDCRRVQLRSVKVRVHKLSSLTGIIL